MYPKGLPWSRAGTKSIPNCALQFSVYVCVFVYACCGFNFESMFPFSDAPLDLKIKASMIADMFSIVGECCPAQFPMSSAGQL